MTGDSEVEEGAPRGVFVSWSGASTKVVAELLAQGIHAIAGVRCFVSSVDVPPGSSWDAEISGALRFNFGVLCINAENRASPWIHFEAGAIWKALGRSDARVIPLLINMEPEDLLPPLSRFHALQCDDTGLAKILHTVFESRSDRDQERSAFESRMAAMMPEMAGKLREAASASPAPPQREIRAMLGEVLDLSRTAARALRQRRGVDVQLEGVVIDADSDGRSVIVIRASSLGQAPATGIALRVLLKSNLISAGGATELVTSRGEERRVIEFVPLRVLSPGAVAEWRIAVTSTHSAEPVAEATLTFDQRFEEALTIWNGQL